MIRISGTDYRPELPNFEEIHKKLLEFNSYTCPTDKAITILLYLMRTQPFLDGNKRVAAFACNKTLI